MDQDKGLRDYIHQKLNQEVFALSGEYVLIKEAQLTFKNREALYLIGNADLYNTCCGSGNFSYASIPGFITKWRYKFAKDGSPISQVEPIRDKETQLELKKLLKKLEIITQVDFQF